jgi:hypothetical protein
MNKSEEGKNSRQEVRFSWEQIPNQSVPEGSLTLFNTNMMRDYFLQICAILDEARNCDSCLEFNLRNEFERIKKRVMVAFFQTPSVSEIWLAPDDSGIFKEASHYSYFFETEKMDVNHRSSKRQEFLETHRQVFIRKE